MDMLKEQQEALGREPFPIVVCIAGNNSRLRRLVSETLNVYFVRKANTILVNVSNFPGGMIPGETMSDWARRKTETSASGTFSGRKFVEICTNEKKIDEYEHAVWSSAESYIETAIDEGGHYILIISGTTLPKISSKKIPEGNYWNEKAYKILVDSPDKSFDDANINYSGVESDIIINSADTFNKESGNIIKSIIEKESYRPSGRHI